MEESQAARPVTMRKQRGFLLWQMAIFMTLSSIVAAYTGQKYWQTTIRESRDDRARLVGTTLAKVTDAVKTYTTAYYQPIQQGQPITVNGYTVPSSRVLTPTLADLNGLGFLPSWATHPIVYSGQSVGFNVAIKIDTSTGCSVPACNLSFQVMTTAPLIDPGSAANVDIRRATIAARTASPGNAGVAMPASFGGDPAIFVTSNGTQIGINPGSVAGLIAMNNNYDSQGFASFLRRDGTLPMTGDLNLKDATGTRHNINNAETVNAQNVNAALDVVAGRDVWATGSVTAEWLHSTKDAQIDRSLTSMGRLYAREYVEVSGWAAQGQGCSPNGLIANSGNGPLFCQSGVWTNIGSYDGCYHAGSAWGSTGWIHNGSAKAVTVNAFYGNNPHAGGNAANPCDLSGHVNTVGMVAGSTTNNDNFAKRCFISFVVPSGASWTINSAPYKGNTGFFQYRVFTPY